MFFVNRNSLLGFQQTIGNFTALRQEGEAPPRYTATATPPPRPQEPPRPQQQRKRPAEQSRVAETPEEEVEQEEAKKVSTKIAKGITVGKYM